MNQRKPLTLDELKTELQNYCDTKGEEPIGADQVKKDFFLTMLNAIETNTLTVEKLDSELINVPTKELFFYRFSWLSPNKKCAAAQLVASLYQAAERPLTDDEFSHIINGNAKELKKIKHYNPFAEFVAPPVSTNPFDAFFNDTVDTDTVQSSNYNPFDDDNFFAIAALQNESSNQSYNPFDTPYSLFTPEANKKPIAQAPPLPPFHPVKVIRK